MTTKTKTKTASKLKPPPKAVTVPGKTSPKKLNATEKKSLTWFEDRIKDARKQGADAIEVAAKAFRDMTEAFHQIREQKLYRETHETFEDYFRDKWDFGRSHANRLADTGELIERLSSHGEILKLMTMESHFRPLTGLGAEQQNQIIETAQTWLGFANDRSVAPALIRTAKVFVLPPESGALPDPQKAEIVSKVTEFVEAAEAKLPKGTSSDVRKLFAQLKKQTADLSRPRSGTGISWTDDTWNPLQGCTHVSKGCDRCYAAKFVATRAKHRYPGLAKKTIVKERPTYNFLGKIMLLPELLGQPLQERTPKLYFVNSMSDLFHKNVPDDFIEAVFEVMKKAHWHRFQVLTKRPERMAVFTKTYFNGSKPPENVWLGATAEDQEAYDDRIKFLRDTTAAVRWLSCEPLLGPIKFDSAKGIEWVVVGGESDSIRPMKKEWATSLRDQCKNADIPFFFKQWGSFNEEGEGPQKEDHSDTTPPTLDGKIHREWPQIPGG